MKLNIIEVTFNYFALFGLCNIGTAAPLFSRALNFKGVMHWRCNIELTILENHINPHLKTLLLY